MSDDLHWDKDPKSGEWGLKPGKGENPNIKYQGGHWEQKSNGEWIMKDDNESGVIGVWNCPGGVLTIDPRGMQVTITHQRLNAAESWVTEWSPGLAKTVRAFFDWLEIRAIRRSNIIEELLWQSGAVVFPVMGLVAHIVLLIVGRANVIALQYIVVK